MTSVLSGVSWATLDVTSQLTAQLFLTETGQPAPYSAFTCCSQCEVTSRLGCSKARRLAGTRALNPPAWCPVLPLAHVSHDLGKSHPLSKLHLHPPWTRGMMGSLMVGSQKWLVSPLLFFPIIFPPFFPIYKLIVQMTRNNSLDILIFGASILCSLPKSVGHFQS